jgi:hypothetical protein
MKDKNGIFVEVGDKINVSSEVDGYEFVGTIEVIKRDRAGADFAEVTDEEYEVYTVYSQQMEKR